jgi:hypothetical protein
MINDNKTKLYINQKIDKKTLDVLITQVLNQFGMNYTVALIDSLKTLGFRYATNGGISIGIEDLRIPSDKQVLVTEAKQDILEINQNWKNSLVTDIERFQKIIDSWNNASESLKTRIVDFFKTSDPLNSIYMIAFSGARGNISQVRQLVGMRGLMADQKGQIIDLPIIPNFREGLSSADYIISSYGARKGIVDTSLRTADSGYLTRRLVEIGQDIIIRDIDCKAQQGIKIDLSFYKNPEINLMGRILAQGITYKKTILIPQNTIIDRIILDKIKNYNIQKLYVRSPITCKAYRAICQYCYGWNLAYHNLVNLGDAIGVIAGQSIGEPGTQMTMRTFHTGGIFTTEVGQQVKAQLSGIIIPLSRLKANSIRSSHGKPVLRLENFVSLEIQDWKNNTQAINLGEGSLLYIEPNNFVKKNQLIAEFSTSSSKSKLPKIKHFKALLSSLEGEISFGDLKIRHELKKERITKYNTKAGLIWILAGKILTLPSQAKINIENYNLIEKKAIGHLKIISSIRGKIIFNLKKSQLQILETILTGSISVFKLVQKVKKLKGQNKNTININYILFKIGRLKFKSFIKDKDNQINFSLFTYRPTFIRATKKKLTKTNFTLFSNIAFLENSYLEILKQKSGFVSLIPNKPWVFKIRTEILSESDKNTFTHIAFNGQKFCNLIRAKEPVLYKVLFKENCEINLLLIYPIYQIQLKKDLELNNLLSFNTEFLKIEDLNTPNFFCHGKNLNLDTLNNKLYFRRYRFSYIAQPFSAFFLNFSSQNKVVFIKKHFINLKKLLDGWTLTNAKVKFNFFIKNNQYIEPYTILGHLEYKVNYDQKLYGIKIQNLDQQHLMLIGPEHVNKIYIEKINKDLLKSTLLLKDTNLNSNLKLKKPGFFLKYEKNHIIVRKANPFFLTEDTIITYEQGEFVKKGDNFAILVNYRQQTEDIVQGLPKIEELMELRGSNHQATLAVKPGIFCPDKRKPKKKKKKEPKFKFRIISAEDFKTTHLRETKKEGKVIEKRDSNIYSLESLDELLVKNYTFVNLAEPITTGVIDPHEMLRIFCNFYQRRDGLVYGIYNSVYKLQQILVNSIQAIYKSQGITIADKHLEVIIRQMTSQVEILESGDTPLIVGEFVDFYVMEDICEILIQNHLYIPYFQPVLRGVTRSALKGESFLSSASFQETKKILTESAIEGKIDWLRSLKANVITGKLIPAGTGFNRYKVNYTNPQFRDLLKFFVARNKDYQNLLTEIPD